MAMEHKIGISRRSFLTRAAGTAAAIATSGAALSSAATTPASPTNSALRPRTYAGSAFGVNLHTDAFPPDLAFKQLAEAKAIGVTWVRGLHASMDLVEGAPGHIDFSRPDSELALLDSFGFNILGQLGPAVAWAAPLDPRRSENLARRSYFPPGRLADWSAHVSRVVERYKATVKFWSPWNEPDAFAYWRPPVDDAEKTNPDYLANRRSAFLDLQKATYTATKIADPTCVVLSPALALGGDFDADFAPWLIGNGLLQYCDIIDFHPYNTTQVIIDNVADIRAWVHAAGARMKPLWITETGLFFRAENTGSGPISHDDIVNFAIKSLATALSLGVQKVFWYEGYVDRTDIDPVDEVTLERSSFSLIVSDGPTPAAWSLSAASHLLQGARFIGHAVVHPQSGTPMALRFATSRGELLIAWARSADSLENQPASAEATVTWLNRNIPLLLSERPTVMLGP